MICPCCRVSFSSPAVTVTSPLSTHKKFPEIMGLPVKMIGVGIFKIVDGDNLCNVQFFGQRETAGKPWIKHSFHWKNVKYVFYDKQYKRKKL